MDARVVSFYIVPSSKFQAKEKETKETKIKDGGGTGGANKR